MIAGSHSFPTRLTLLRERRGLTQQALAERSNLSLRTILRLEAGDYEPRLDTVRKLAEALDLDPFALLYTGTSDT